MSRSTAATDSAVVGTRRTAVPSGLRRALFRIGVTIALVLVAGGTTLAVVEWRATAGPGGAVRGYFDALARGDAATALGYGSIPDGPRTFLTGTVLAEQQRLAPLTDVHIVSVTDDGDRARVRVRYVLDFPDVARGIETTVGVRRVDGEWRLDQVVAATQVLVAQASDRATLAGASIPGGTTLLFPGAVPIRFDTPYLRVSATDGTVGLDADPSTQIGVDVSASGRTAALSALPKALTGCLSQAADPRCPLPSERYVPGSVRGTVVTPLSDGIKVTVGASDAGELELSGSVTVKGDFVRLEFDNTRTTRRDTSFSLPVNASAYAVRPLVLRWDRPS